MTYNNDKHNKASATNKVQNYKSFQLQLKWAIHKAQINLQQFILNLIHNFL